MYFSLRFQFGATQMADSVEAGKTGKAPWTNPA
jgi:hypothetical protein